MTEEVEDVPVEEDAEAEAAEETGEPVDDGGETATPENG